MSSSECEASDSIREQINEKLKDYDTINKYTVVKVLVLYWEDGDHKGFKAEGAAIGNMFQRLFNFDVEYFSIPSVNSHIHLDTVVAQTLLALSSTTSKGQRLLIIHYGGHGDPNNKHHAGEEKRSVWAAYVQIRDQPVGIY